MISDLAKFLSDLVISDLRKSFTSNTCFKLKQSLTHFSAASTWQPCSWLAAEPSVSLSRASRRQDREVRQPAKKLAGEKQKSDSDHWSVKKKTIEMKIAKFLNQFRVGIIVHLFHWSV